jgi:hypothetical protein
VRAWLLTSTATVTKAPTARATAIRTAWLRRSGRELKVDGSRRSTNMKITSASVSTRNCVSARSGPPVQHEQHGGAVADRAQVQHRGEPPVRPRRGDRGHRDDQADHRLERAVVRLQVPADAGAREERGARHQHDRQQHHAEVDGQRAGLHQRRRAQRDAVDAVRVAS